MSDSPRDATTLPPRTMAFVEPPTDGDNHLPVHAGRIELLGELARGGMGAVLRGHDPALRREVAVKVLLPSHSARPDLVRRFLEEAQVAGQLQHPGVVPVYDLGTFSDGRPYFAMKLVQGRTLAEMLAVRPNAGHELSRYLKIFEAVCQAVAFAHSHKIIHRDLKPLNVMVGAFGEVQVMDWGIAKVLGDPASDPSDSAECGVRNAELKTTPADRPSRTPNSELRTPHSDRTAAGTTLGTLAYMPPEQAAGDPVDERADVFGLGAILCEILTGKPPYAGSHEEVLWNALNGDLANANTRLDQCGADAELVALARRCLSPNRDDRPRDAAAVAAGVSQYLAGVQERLQQITIERAAAEARILEERKRRRMQVWLAGVVLIALLGAGGIGFWIQRDRAAQRADAEQRVAVAMQKAQVLESQGQLQSALEAAGQARDLASDPRVDAAVRDSAAQFADALHIANGKAESDRLLVERLQDASDIAESGIAPAAGTPQTQREFLVYHFEFVFRHWGADVRKDSPDEILPLMKSRSPAVRRQMAAGLDQWAWLAKARRRPAEYWRPLIALAAEIDPDQDPIRKELRAGLAPVAHDASANNAVVRLRALADRSDPNSTPPETLVLLALELQAAGDLERAIEVLRSATRARPGEVLLHERLAHLLLEVNPPRRTEAIAHLQMARALRPRLGARLAMVLVEAGETAEALALCRSAELSRNDPEVPYLRAGEVLLNRGQAGKALPFLEAARDRAPTSRSVRMQVAGAYEQLGRYATAQAEYQSVIDAPPVQSPQRSENASLNALNAAFVAQGQAGVQRCRRLAELDARLPAILAGTDRVPLQDRLTLARATLNRGDWNESVALFSDAFAEDPSLLAPVNSLRYNAACAAVLAANANDDSKPEVGARQRRQAFDWLQSELAALKDRLASASTSEASSARRLLRHWQVDVDLETIRNNEKLRRLPGAERDQWIALWAEVDSLQKGP